MQVSRIPEGSGLTIQLQKGDGRQWLTLGREDDPRDQIRPFSHFLESNSFAENGKETRRPSYTDKC